MHAEDSIMRTTIKDIARECGVSTATVSLALSGRKTKISEKTCKKIRETAERMNYYPNIMASSLARHKSQSVGIVINDLRNTHIAALFMSISSVLQNAGFFPVCHILNENDPEMYEMLVRRIASENLCALIWGKPYEPSLTEMNKKVCRIVDTLGIPIFSTDNSEFKSPGINICCDYRKAAFLAVQYLISQGHTRIGCIAGYPSFQVTQDRIDGYRDALTQAGLSYDPNLIYYGDYSLSGGRAALPYLLGQQVSAIFSMNDEMAFGVYQEARNYGLKIPDALSVIGCDNVPFDNVLEVPLSTVGTPTDEMGRFIGQEVCRSIDLIDSDGPDALGERRTVYYEPNLYLRGSVRPYPPI